MQPTRPSGKILLPCLCGIEHQLRDPRVKIHLCCRNCGAILLYECNGNGRHLLRGLHGEFAIEKSGATIGRRGDWKINYPPLSRIHCSFEISDGICYLRDTGSRNGTWLNGKRLTSDESYPMYGGELLRLADLQFRYLSPSINGSPSPIIEQDLVDTELEIPSLQLVTNDKLIGRVISGYRLGMLLSQGGMGRVYIAMQMNTGEKRAVKVILPQLRGSDGALSEDDRLQRFLQEMHLSVQLRHPNIITCYDVGQIGELLYILMEYFDGRNLRRCFVDQPATPEQVIDIGIKSALALTYAHSFNIVHRDIKPENIMYAKDGAVKVIDFGIAKAINQSDDATLSTIDDNGYVGTLRYMAPEQTWAHGKITARSDIYSLGATLFFCLAGCSPYEKIDSVSMLREQIKQGVPSLKEYCHNVPQKLIATIDRALKIDPDERFATAEEFAAALATARQ